MNEERKIAVEEVDAVEAPPKARVERRRRETFERKRDYLEGFLAQKPAADDARRARAARCTRRWSTR